MSPLQCGLVSEEIINATSVACCLSTLFTKSARLRSMGSVMAPTRDPAMPANEYTQKVHDHTKIKRWTFFCNYNHYQVVQPDFQPVIVVQGSISFNFILQYVCALHIHTKNCLLILTIYIFYVIVD